MYHVHVDDVRPISLADPGLAIVFFPEPLTSGRRSFLASKKSNITTLRYQPTISNERNPNQMNKLRITQREIYDNYA